MAFNGCSRECVRAVALPYILFSLVMGRPLVQRLLIAYTVDLIGILRELFSKLFSNTLRPVSPTITWTELQEAIVAYEQSSSRQRIHHSITSKIPLSGPILTIDGVSRMVCELLQDSPNTGTRNRFFRRFFGEKTERKT